MSKLRLPSAALAAALFAAPALAQTAAEPSGTPQSGTTQTGASTPTAGTPTPAATPAPSSGALPGVAATAGNPNLAVATVKLENGRRLSKIIGADVYGGGGQQLGKVDDLVMMSGDKVGLAVLAVGGFLGLGSKLIAFPFDDLKTDGDRLTLPDVTPDALNKMPNFQY